MVVQTDWLKGITDGVRLIVVGESSGFGVDSEETNNGLGSVTMTEGAVSSVSGVVVVIGTASSKVEVGSSIREELDGRGRTSREELAGRIP